MRALVLQHIACEPPGTLEDVLVERGVAIIRAELDEGDPLPGWQDVDLIVAMGGPMSVNDEDQHGWLAAEKRLIGEAVRARVPYWGACLGAQLLAASLGARVYPGPAPEVGVLPVTLTAAAAGDPLFAGLGPELSTLQWHGETFDLPAGGVRLARSPAYPNQAFRWGALAYGAQFHVEVSASMARDWSAVPAYRQALERVHGPGAFPRLLAAFERERPQMQAAARTVFGRWLDLAGRPARGPAPAGGPSAAQM